MSRVFTGSFKVVCRKFKGYFKEFTTVFQENSGKFQGVLNKVSRVFQLRLKGVLSSFKGLSRACERRTFQECFKKVLMVFQESYMTFSLMLQMC